MFSVCPHLRGGVPEPGPAGGGYPSQVQLGEARSSRGGYPRQVQPGGYPDGGYPTLATPHQTWPEGYPGGGGYPTLGTPHQTWPGVS